MEDSSLVRAYQRVLRTHHLYADELVCTPSARTLFLAFAREEGVSENVCERDILLRLINLRKRSRLPRSSDVSVLDGVEQS